MPNSEVLPVLPIPLVVDFFLYGFYICLSSLALFVLLTRRSPGFKVHVTAITILFVSTTLRVVLATVIFCTYRLDIHNPQDEVNAVYLIPFFDALDSLAQLNLAVPREWLMAMKLSFTMTHITADAFLIYRCYCIWGYRKRVIAVPCFFFMLTALTQLVATQPLLTDLVSSSLPESSLRWVGYMCGLVTQTVVTSLLSNLLVTGLSAGRLWWLHKNTSIDCSSAARYNKAAAIILGSGLVYPCVLIVLVVLLLTVGGYMLSVLVVVTYQAAATAPALVIVGTGLGVNALDLSERVGKARNYDECTCS